MVGGDHAVAGYLTGYTEIDPVFSAWDKNYNDLTNTPTLFNPSTLFDDYGFTDNSTDWNTAFGWGDHSLTGYLTIVSPGNLDATNAPLSGYIPLYNGSNFTWVDTTGMGSSGGGSGMVYPGAGIAVSTGTSWGTSIIDNSTNWNTAYGWGDHAAAGYLTSFVETDPVFSIWDKDYYDLINTPTLFTPSTLFDDYGFIDNSFNWDMAYGWGDHSIEGYLKSFIEEDPVFTAHPAFGITENDISNWNSTTGFSSTDITNWNTAYGWGNHALAGYLLSEVDPEFISHPAYGILNADIENWTAAYGWGNHALVGYLTSESDPVFGIHPASDITATDISNWNLVYGWGNHSSVGYLTSEVDPVFGIHPASTITATDIFNWDLVYSWGIIPVWDTLLQNWILCLDYILLQLLLRPILQIGRWHMAGEITHGLVI